VTIHGKAVAVNPRGRFGITQHDSIQLHATGANQLTGLGARTISHLRERTSQANFSRFGSFHVSMLIEAANSRVWEQGLIP
jgi:hypothetical protein